MTATWEMQAKTPDNKLVSLCFYHGPSGPPPNYILLQGMVDNHQKPKRRFHSQPDADEWAAALGVTSWLVVQHTRAFPEAARIPIIYSEAPGIPQLLELIAKLEAGTKLDDLVDGVMINHDGHQFPVNPNLLRLWLIGAAPDHPALQLFKRYREHP